MSQVGTFEILASKLRKISKIESKRGNDKAGFLASITARRLEIVIDTVNSNYDVPKIMTKQLNKSITETIKELEHMDIRKVYTQKEKQLFIRVSVAIRAYPRFLLKTNQASVLRNADKLVNRIIEGWRK